MTDSPWGHGTKMSFKSYFVSIYLFEDMCYSKNMGEVIKFPTTRKPASVETGGNNSETAGNPIKACLFECIQNITIGGEVVVHVYGKKHKGIVTTILQRDENNNITKIAYTIPFLSGDDPLKFGEADFTYATETYD